MPNLDRQTPCPSCGASVTFKFAGAKSVVCDYCSAVVARTDRGFEMQGRMSAVLDIPGPIQYGATGEWSGQPFEILADLRGDRNPHFAVRWTPSLGGSQIGVARTQWSPAKGLEVISVELVTRSPFDPSRSADPNQVRLTAAHEMGHALGLQHSDASRDIMYPTNTATSMSAQDFRSIEVLYRMEDGTQIRR